MAIYHCTCKPVSRAEGRCATGAAAYRSGENIQDERTGEVYDYTRKQGVIYKEVVLPEEISAEITRHELWNMAEAAEKRKDARVAREWEIALPSELTAEQRKEAALDFARELAERYGVAADVCIHAPNKKGDQRNHHAHIMTTTRKLTPDGLKQKSDIELKDKDLKALGKPVGRAQIEAIRQLWEERCNKALEKSGIHAKIDSRSYEAQGVAKCPGVHVGPIATAMERRGIQTERGNLNRPILTPDRVELGTLERVQSGVNAARERLHAEIARRIEAKRQAEEQERQRKAQEAERERLRKVKRDALEIQYGEAMSKMFCPTYPPNAKWRPDYQAFLDKLLVAQGPELEKMKKDLAYAEKRFGMFKLFEKVAEIKDTSTILSEIFRERDRMLKVWEQLPQSQQTKMEQAAREFTKAHEHELHRDRERGGMSL